MGLNYYYRTCLPNLKPLRPAPYNYLGSSILGGGGGGGGGLGRVGEELFYLGFTLISH
jgi:hypothetical protein